MLLSAGDPLAGSGSWPQPLLGGGLDRGGHGSQGYKIRLPNSSKIFLTVIIIHSLLMASLRLFTDIIWKMPVVASNGLLDSRQNSWFFVCFLISSIYNVLLAFDAVLNESRSALFACLGSSFILGLRSVIEFSYQESACSQANMNWICVPGLVEVIGYQVLLIALGLGSVVTQMGFRFYRIVGADLSLRDIYDTYIQWVTLYRLNQQFALLAFTTALFFSNSLLQTIFAISFFVLEFTWELIAVVAIHTEDVRLSRLSTVLAFATPVYLSILFVLLSGNPVFFDSLMLFKLFFIVFVNITNRIILEIYTRRLRDSFGQGFRSRILAKLNLLALALPIRCLSSSSTCYPMPIDLQAEFCRHVSEASSGENPSAADL